MEFGTQINGSKMFNVKSLSCNMRCIICLYAYNNQHDIYLNQFKQFRGLAGPRALTSDGWHPWLSEHGSSLPVSASLLFSSAECPRGIDAGDKAFRMLPLRTWRELALRYTHHVAVIRGVHSLSVCVSVVKQMQNPVCAFLKSLLKVGTVELL